MFLGHAAKLREHSPATSDARFFRELAEQCVWAATLGYAFEQPLPTVNARLTSALEMFVEALQRGPISNPVEVNWYFSIALTVGDPSTAHFLAALPDKQLGLPARPAALPEQMQLRVATAVFRREETRAAMYFEVLEGLSFDVPLDDECKDPPAEVQNVCRLIEGILRKDASTFGRHLRERMTLRARAAAAEQRNDPLRLIDFKALGLCRLAQARGMTASVQHVYLPLALLDPG